jgi:hypothetical protein
VRMSEKVENISKALAKFQAEVTNPKNTADNPFFKSKYAPLQDILSSVRPLLAKQGLAILQNPSGDGKNIAISTLILHESGEWIELDPLILQAEKATAQGAGSAITYGRRYALSAALGISSEDDDDGNHASNLANKKTEVRAIPKRIEATKEAAASADERRRLMYAAKIAGLNDAELQAYVREQTGKENSRDLTPEDIEKCVAALAPKELTATRKLIASVIE